MAVKEFLDAVDKKKKAEEAAMAADAPVSAEVAPATPAMQAPIATPQQLDQMLADPATVVVDNVASANATIDSAAAPAIQAPVATPQQLDQMLADPATVNVDNITPAMQAPIAAPSVLNTPAPVAPAQTDVLTSAPTVQAPAVQEKTPLFQSAESGRRFARGVGYAADAVAGAGSAAMDAGSNLVNSSSDAVAGLISQNLVKHQQALLALQLPTPHS
jgi:hypothetical protein